MATLGMSQLPEALYLLLTVVQQDVVHSTLNSNHRCYRNVDAHIVSRLFFGLCTILLSIIKRLHIHLISSFRLPKVLLVNDMMCRMSSVII